MRLDKLTTAFQQALADGQSTAVARDNPYVEPAHVLAADQVDLSRRFARPSSAKFDEGEWTDGQGGAPLLAGCVAVFECRRRSHHAAGDHVLFIGAVERIGGTAATPLVYHGGHYHTLNNVE